MKQEFTRFLLLQKRMIRRKSYVAMVLSVLLFVAVLRGISTAESGLATIAIYVEEGADDTALKLRDNIMGTDSVILYREFDSADEAIDETASGRADATWIIPADLSRTVLEFAEKERTRHPINIYVREQNVIHFFLQEILQSQVYRLAGSRILDDYSYENLGTGNDEYERYIPGDSIFKLYNIGDPDASEEMNYIVMPLRGFMALWLMISAIASAMYYIYDKNNGLFIFWKTRNAFLRELMYHLIVTLDSAVIALFGLLVGGVFTGVLKELAAMAVYVVILTLFSMFVRLLLDSEMAVGVFTPVMITVAAIFSPVFVDLRSYKVIQNIVPPFHYLKSVFDPYYFKGGSVFAVCLFAVSLGLYFLRGKISERI